MDGLRTLKEQLTKLRREVLIPQPRLTLSEWADTYRMLSSEASAEPGKWQTSRTPYLREVQDSITDPLIPEITVMSSAQCGKTELLLNSVGYFIHQDPCPILLLEPTSELAATVSKTRIAPAIRDTKELSRLVASEKSRDSANTIREKLFRGGSLSILGSNTPNSLASRPIRILLMDEIDRYPIDVAEEGSPIELAKRRTATFYNRKIVSVSTPTIAGISPTERRYHEGSQGRYHVRCTHKECNELFEPQWKDVRWIQDNDGRLIDTSVKLVCPHCGHEHDDAMRLRASSHGQWVHRFPDRKHKSFHLSALVSPWVRLNELVETWLSAQSSVELLKTFVNTILGQTWEESSQGVDNIDFMMRREDYDQTTLPENIELVTAGVDVQQDRLEVSFYGWARNDESYFIKHTVITSDPAHNETWVQLKDDLSQEFQRVDAATLKVMAVCIDSGGGHTETVYQFAKKNRQKRYWAIKGRSNYQGNLPIFPKRASRGKNNYLLFTVGVDTAKTQIYSWLKNKQAGSNYVHFNFNADEDFFEQLTAERVKTKYRNGYPYRVWYLPSNTRNEALDCFVYALAARTGLRFTWDRLHMMNKKTIPGNTSNTESEPVVTDAVTEIEDEKPTEKPIERLMNQHKSAMSADTTDQHKTKPINKRKMRPRQRTRGNWMSGINNL